MKITNERTRNILIIVIIVFIVVQIGRIAGFSEKFDNKILAWLTALSLESLIIISALLSRWAKVQWSITSYFVCIAFSAAFSVGYIKPGIDPLMWAYALMPNVCLALSGLQLRDIEKTIRAKSAKSNAKSETSKKVHVKPIAKKKDWKLIHANLNGTGENLNAKQVKELIESNGFDVPKLRTYQIWAEETRK